MNLLHRHKEIVKPMATDLASVRLRSLLVAAVLGVSMLGLIWRAYQVSVVQHEHYADLGNRQQLRSYRVRASRGDIVDRNYIALAVTDRVHKIVLNPRLIAGQGATEAVVAKVMELFPLEDAAYLRDELSRDKAYRQLRMQLDDAQAKAIREARLPGVRLEPMPHRVYPRKLLASQALGRVSAEGSGNLGIEYGMDEFLKGRDAMSPAYFARGQKLLVDGHPDPSVSRGNTVVLTLDSALQAMVEEEINTLVENWTPVSASVLVVDPRNGEVLAMASRPTFDPNHGIDDIDQTVNHAVNRAFEPGSTMKAITVAAALEQGVIRRDESFFCENGRWQYTEDHAIRDTKQLEWLSISEILAVSSNICTTKIYDRLRAQNLDKWVRRFHFGERPAIELPGATRGTLDDWNKWSDIQGANISFGQGMSASPLQVAAAFSVLANGGTYHPPTIIRAVLDHDGNEAPLDRKEPERVVRTSTADTVLEMLENVVHSKKGTGKNALIDGYRVAGKTSTAQKASKSGGYAEDEYFASFVGAVPAKDPRVVILVSVDNPVGGHYGNEVAAPTFARLGKRVMLHMGVPRDDGSRPSPDPLLLMTNNTKLVDGFTPLGDVEPELPGQRPISVDGGLPDFTGLSLVEALDAADGADIRLVAQGTGIAVMQDVPPGPMESGTDAVTVFFEPPA
ncbi:MAG: penicillin-binding transpeptidase domain-containing protein [Nannocystales bacterium]